MHRVLESVILTRDIPEAGLNRGDLGAIVEVFADDAYEVEFVAQSGRTQALLTLRAADLQPLDGKPPCPQGHGLRAASR